MKILLLSDTHTNVSGAVGLIRGRGDFELFFHLGDTYQDAVRIHDETGLPMKAVSGNMDGLRVGPDDEVFTLEGVCFFLVHGDRYAVNRDRSRLVAEAERREADVVCYGHTHVARDETVAGHRLINPGALRPGNGSYAILDLNDGQVKCEFYPI